MKKSVKITVVLILFIIVCGVGTYLFLNMENLEIKHQVYWIIGGVLDLALFFVVVFLVETKKNDDLEEVHPTNDLPVDDFKLKKIEGKKIVVRKDSESSEYKKEYNLEFKAFRFIWFTLGILLLALAFFLSF